jgi:hypothetical protein
MEFSSLAFLPNLIRAPSFWLGVLSFVLVLAFPWPLLSAGHALRWAILFTAVPLCLLWLPHERLTPVRLLGLLFLGWAGLSLAWAPDLAMAANAWLKFALMGGLFMIGAQLPSLRPVYLGLGAGFAINSAVVAAQYLGWQGFPQTAIPGGLFVNRSMMSEIALMVLVALLVERVWWLAAAVAPSALVWGSREGVAVIGLLGMVWLWGKSRFLALLLLLAVLAAIGHSIVNNDHNDMTGRLAIWRDTVSGLTWRGHGAGSFSPDFPLYAETYGTLHMRPRNAHNDYLELAFDLGPIGLGLWLALIAMVMRWGRERWIIGVFLLEGWVGFPLHYPLTSALAAIVAGRLCGHGHVVVASVDDIGVPLLERLAGSAYRKRSGGAGRAGGAAVSARP